MARLLASVPRWSVRLARPAPLGLASSVRALSSAPCACAPASSPPPPPPTQPSSDADAATTHFGFRTVPEERKESLVGQVFASVAGSYDVMNDTMSLGIHRVWKDHLVHDVLDPRGGLTCLDVAGGTGDVALRILDHARTRYADRSTAVTVCDINASMLRAGQKRLKSTMYWNTPQLTFALGNAEDLSQPLAGSEPATKGPSPTGPNAGAAPLPPLPAAIIPSSSVDLYTIAFGIRNVTHPQAAINEAYRVLKPGGVFAVLEFGKVGIPLLAELYRLYSFNVLPLMGELVAGDRDSYQYLVESIARFPDQPTFARMIRQAGFLLPGDAQAEQLGWHAFDPASGLAPMPSLANGPGAAVANAAVCALEHLPGIGSVVAQQKQAIATQRAINADVQGAYQDLTFGIATIWLGIKPADAPTPPAQP